MSVDTLSLDRSSVQAQVDAVERLATWLLERRDLPSATTVTWVNHYSAQVALRECPEELRKFDVIGVDGIMLRRLVKAPSRTSADLLLPVLLPQLRDARVLIVGGRPEAMMETVECIGEMLGEGSTVVAAIDGYEGVSGDGTLDEIVLTAKPDIVIVGMGAPRQEMVAQQIAKMLERGLVLTCGGYLDQIRHGAYYPAWAYPLRLNWLVRVAREPRRLWRRYTVQAFGAFRARHDLRQQLWSLAGFVATEMLSEDEISGLPVPILAPTPVLEATPEQREPVDHIVIDITDRAMAARASSLEARAEVVIDLRENAYAEIALTT